MKILIADDEPVARQVLREHVEAIPHLEMVGEASTGAETLHRILDLEPDVVLLDQQMPELDGLAVVRSLSRHAYAADYFRHCPRAARSRCLRGGRGRLSAQTRAPRTA